jgi:hypothetical protein
MGMGGTHGRYVAFLFLVVSESECIPLSSTGSKGKRGGGFFSLCVVRTEGAANKEENGVLGGTYETSNYFFYIDGCGSETKDTSPKAKDEARLGLPCCSLSRYLFLGLAMRLLEVVVVTGGVGGLSAS